MAEFAQRMAERSAAHHVFEFDYLIETVSLVHGGPLDADRGQYFKA